MEAGRGLNRADPNERRKLSRRQYPTSGRKLSSTVRCSALEPVAVSGIGDLPLVAAVAAGPARRPGPGQVGDALRLS